MTNEQLLLWWLEHHNSLKRFMHKGVTLNKLMASTDMLDIDKINLLREYHSKYESVITKPVHLEYQSTPWTTFLT